MRACSGNWPISYACVHVESIMRKLTADLSTNVAPIRTGRIWFIWNFMVAYEGKWCDYSGLRRVELSYFEKVRMSGSLWNFVANDYDDEVHFMSACRQILYKELQPGIDFFYRIVFHVQLLYSSKHVNICLMRSHNSDMSCSSQSCAYGALLRSQLFWKGDIGGYLVATASHFF